MLSKSESANGREVKSSCKDYKFDAHPGIRAKVIGGACEGRVGVECGVTLVAGRLSVTGLAFRLLISGRCKREKLGYPKRLILVSYCCNSELLVQKVVVII